MILTERITGPAAWRGCDLIDNESWIYHLSEVEIAALDQAVTRIQNHDLGFPRFGRADFSIPELKSLLTKITTELENGRGFILVRGLPVERYSEEQLKTLYYGIGLNLGAPVTQNPAGDLLGIVANVGDPKNKHTRVYETNAYLPYHTDPSDVVGLLCLRQVRAGGLSSLVSAAAVYNELLATRSELIGLYYRPMYYAHLGDVTRSPIFSYNDGKLSCRYLRQYIELGHEIHDSPLSRVERHALDHFDQIMQAPDMRIDMMLQPGDIQFANNYAVMHSRTGFEDHQEPSRHRKMLRLWLKMPDARRLACDFPGRDGFGLPTLRDNDGIS